MFIHARHTPKLVATTVVSWRYLAQRFSFVFFLLFSLGLLILGHQRPVLVSAARVRIMDGAAPVLDALSRPLAATRDVSKNISDYFHLREENDRLREQVSQAARWQTMALSLDNENKELRRILNYKLEPSLAYISARVIGDTGGAYARSMIVTAGRQEGVREGMAAMTGEGLIGRVVEVGDWSSRVLLITDLNSRIPVTIVNPDSAGGEHAILAGDNGVQPRLLYLPLDAHLKQGDRVLTSGHGGVFPPNLPVGVVVSKGGDGYQVEPMAALGRVNQVRLVDFNLAGGVLNPLSPAATASQAVSGPAATMAAP